jgi:predicted double-glycine peptidase
MWWGNLRDRNYFEDPGLNGSIILIWSFRKWWDEGHGLD